MKKCERCCLRDSKPCYECSACAGGDDHFRADITPPTNADHIRSMSDEELAVTLMCPNEMGMADIQCDHSDDKNCCKCLLDWLRQPAETEGME